MFLHIEHNIISDFDIADLHKKVGQILVIRPTDSDLQEGLTKTQVYFVDSDRNFYLLDELDD